MENIFPNSTSIVSSYSIKNKIFVNKYQTKSSLSNQNKILISNGGYNFKRLCNFFRKLNYKIYLPVFQKVSFIEKIIYFLRGITIVNFKKKEKEKTHEDFIENINFIYLNNYDLSFLNTFYQSSILL